MSADQARYHRTPGVPSRRVHDVLLLLAADRQVVELGGAGPDLWELLEQPISVGDAVDRLATAYAVPADSIRPDVTQTVTMLADLNLLSRAEP